MYHAKRKWCPKENTTADQNCANVYVKKSVVVSQLRLSFHHCVILTRCTGKGTKSSWEVHRCMPTSMATTLINHRPTTEPTVVGENNEDVGRSPTKDSAGLERPTAQEKLRKPTISCRYAAAMGREMPCQYIMNFSAELSNLVAAQGIKIQARPQNTTRMSQHVSAT